LLGEDVYVLDEDVNIPPVFRPSLRGERALLDKGTCGRENVIKKYNKPNIKEYSRVKDKKDDYDTNKDINDKLLSSVNRLTHNLEAMMSQINSFLERLYTLEVSSFTKDKNGGSDNNGTKTKDVEIDKRRKDKIINYIDKLIEELKEALLVRMIL